jgi:hypothetical protein
MIILNENPMVCMRAGLVVENDNPKQCEKLYSKYGFSFETRSSAKN